MLLEALCRVLEHHTWALAEYQDQTQAGCASDELEQFKVGVLEPALRDCERLRGLTQNNPDPIYEEERSLIEQLEECHQENLRTFRELSQPRKSMLLKEFTTLAEKATAVQAKCQEIRLALRKHRKERTLVAALS
jgi:hypothetical protein